MRACITFSMEDSVASMVHNYKHGFSGFAAMLSDDEAKQLTGEEFADHFICSTAASSL